MWAEFSSPGGWEAFFSAAGGERERVQWVRVRLLGVYDAEHNRDSNAYSVHRHDGDEDEGRMCIEAFRRQDQRLAILVRKMWRGVLERLPGGCRGVDVDVGCGRHFEREKWFVVERVEGRRKRRVWVRVGGCVDRYGVEVLEGCVRRVLRGVGWVAEGEVGGEWVVVEGVGGRRVEEVGRGWVEEV